MELPGEWVENGELVPVVDFVMTGVGMGELNISFGFAMVGIRGIDSSFVSNGLRNALGPCCALKLLLGCGVVLLIGFDEAAIFDKCCFCRYANVLKSAPCNGNGGVFDEGAFVAVAAAIAAAVAADGGLLVPSALYRLFKYEE